MDPSSRLRMAGPDVLRRLATAGLVLLAGCGGGPDTTDLAHQPSTGAPYPTPGAVLDSMGPGWLFAVSDARTDSRYFVDALASEPDTVEQTVLAHVRTVHGNVPGISNRSTAFTDATILYNCRSKRRRYVSSVNTDRYGQEHFTRPSQRWDQVPENVTAERVYLVACGLLAGR